MIVDKPLTYSVYCVFKTEGCFPLSKFTSLGWTRRLNMSCLWTLFPSMIKDTGVSYTCGVFICWYINHEPLTSVPWSDMPSTARLGWWQDERTPWPRAGCTSTRTLRLEELSGWSRRCPSICSNSPTTCWTTTDMWVQAVWVKDRIERISLVSGLEYRVAWVIRDQAQVVFFLRHYVYRVSKVYIICAF